MVELLDSFTNYSITEKNDIYLLFAKDFLRYIILDYHFIESWEPQGFLKEDSNGSPFVPEVKWAVESFLDQTGSDIQTEYDIDFPSEDDVSPRSLLEKFIYKNSIFENKPFHEASFLAHLCKCGIYAVLSYTNGIQTAPDIFLRTLYDLLLKMRLSGKIPHNFWIEFIKYCNSYAQEDRLRKRLKLPTQRKRKNCEK